MRPKVSVIIPVYNVEAYIEKCLHSLFEQTLDSLEYIFIDDCTPDKSIDIIEKVLESYPTRKNQVKIIHHKSNTGVGQARQDGINEATGEYIIHCDPDDWLDLDMYEKMYLKASQENVDIVICDYYESFDNKEIIKHLPFKENKEDVIKEIFKGYIPSYLWNKLIKRENYYSIDPVFIEGLNFWEDVSVISRLIYNANSISFISQPLYHYYRQNNNSYTKNKNHNHSEEIFKCLLINYNFFKSENFDVTPFFSRGYNLILQKKGRKNRNFYRKKIKENIHIKPKAKYLIGKSNKIIGFLYFNKLDTLANILKFGYQIISK